MKRTFTFLMSLFLCVGMTMKAQTVITAVSDLKNDKVYTIVPEDATRGAMYATSTSTYLDACGGTRNGAANPSVAIDAASVDQQFAFYTHGDALYLYSVGAGKFVSDVANNFFSLNDQPGNTVSVVESSVAGKFIIKANGTDFINVSTGYTVGCVAGWNYEDAGNRLVITEVAAMPEATIAQLNEIFSAQVKVTYEYKYGETTWATEVVNAIKGKAFPAGSMEFPFGVSPELPQGVVEGEGTVAVNLSVNLPFEYAETFEDAEENWNWYHLLFHADQRNYLYYDDTVDYLDANKSTIDDTNEDAYTWAFVGNPFDGFKVVNRLAGAGKALKATANGAIVGDGGHTFTLTTSPHGTNGFYMASAEGENTQRFNKQGGKVVYWTGADAGSTFMVEIRPTEDQLLAALLEQANELLEVNMGNIAAEGTVPAIGQYTWEAAMELMNAVDAEEPTAELLEAAITAFVTSKNLPVFTIDGVIDYAAGKSIYENEAGGLNFKATDLAEEAMLWTFDMTENTVGVTESVVVRNLATGNLFWGAPSIKITETSDAVEGEDDGIFLFYTEGNTTPIHAQNNGQTVVRYNSTEATSGSAWKFTYVGTAVELKANKPSFDTEIVGVTPVEGEVTELKEIIVQFSNDKVLPYSNIYVMDAKENVYEFVLDANHPDYTQAKYVSMNAITAAGTYILDCSQIDHMDMMTGNTINPFEGTFTWTIKESAPTFDTEIVGVTPVEGEVTELKEIIVQFSNDKILPYSNIYVMDAKENVYEFVLDANHPDYTQAKYVSMNAITAAGTYILDCSQIDHMDMMTGQTINPFEGTFTWTIKESAPTFDTEIVGVTPVEGEVTELKEIIVQFSNDKILPYSNIFLVDEAENTYEFELDINHPDFTQAKYVAKNGAITAAGTYTLDCSQIDHMDMMTGNTINPFTGTFSWTIKVVEDGIDSINANAKAVIYDIHGRRVEKMEKGIYIVNGKKVIKK